jgi:hypothetical protein
VGAAALAAYFLTMSKRKARVDYEDKYLVVTTEFPAVGSGVHSRGRTFSEAELLQRTSYESQGDFDTEKEAIAAALKVRRSSPYFEDWAEDHFKKSPPPWDSTEGENYDNDEEQRIRVMRRSAYDAEQASNAALLAKAAADAVKAASKAKKQKQAALSKSGRVHYYFPGPPRGVDSPASVEAVIGKDGAAYAVPRGQVLSIATSSHSIVDTAALAECKSLLVHGRGDDAASSMQDDLECYKRGISALLEACTSLLELHWHDAKGISEVLTGRVDGSPDDAAQLPETRLSRSLRVLSIPYSRCFAPEDLEDLARFRALERLDLRGSLELEYGIGNPKCYRDPYDSDEGGEDDEPMPYSNGMLAVADANTRLKEIDLDGIRDFDGLKYTLDDDVLHQLAAKGVSVNLGRKTAW